MWNKSLKLGLGVKTMPNDKNNPQLLELANDA